MKKDKPVLIVKFIIIIVGIAITVGLLIQSTFSNSIGFCGFGMLIPMIIVHLLVGLLLYGILALIMIVSGIAFEDRGKTRYEWVDSTRFSFGEYPFWTALICTLCLFVLQMIGIVEPLSFIFS